MFLSSALHRVSGACLLIGSAATADVLAVIRCWLSVQRRGCIPHSNSSYLLAAISAVVERAGQDPWEHIFLGGRPLAELKVAYDLLALKQTTLDSVQSRDVRYVVDVACVLGFVESCTSRKDSTAEHWTRALLRRACQYGSQQHEQRTRPTPGQVCYFCIPVRPSRRVLV